MQVSARLFKLQGTTPSVKMQGRWQGGAGQDGRSLTLPGARAHSWLIVMLYCSCCYSYSMLLNANCAGSDNGLWSGIG